MSRSFSDSIINWTQLEDLNLFFSFSICSGVKLKIGMIWSLKMNVKMLKCNKDIPTTYSCKRQQVLCYHRVWNLFGRYKDFFSLLPLQLSLVETFIFLFSSSWFFLSQFLKFKMNPKLSFHLFFLHQLLRNLSNFAGVLQSEMANSLSHTQYAELSFRREIFERLLVSNQRKWFDYCSRMVVGSGWFSNTFWHDKAQWSILRCTADGSSRTSTASGRVQLKNHNKVNSI